MPARDRLHNNVVNALTKAGWQVSHQQVLLVVAKRRLWIDLQASRAENQGDLLIEVKGFERMPSPVEYLASALGQYLMYRTLLGDTGIFFPLYMAVPERAYNGLLSERLGRRMIEKFAVRLVIFDPVGEEILQWAPQP
jgi:hypothetical protein